MKKVLFVCSGNVFRSLSAEYLLKQYLKDNKISGWKISSAGTQKNTDQIDPLILSTLEDLGVQDINHHRRVVNKAIIDENDYIIAMADYHQALLEKDYQTSSKLFNEVATGEATSIWDINDQVEDYEHHRDQVEEYIESTIKDLHKKMPRFFEHLSR